jgi:transposase
MSESMALVGLDVHQAQTVAAVLDPSSGELRVERLRGVPDRVVPVFLEELDRPVRAVYEAGPTGFALARVAEERGLDVRVVAPGSIPKAPGDRVKTDRRDAKRLVRLFAAGELSFAFIPSETDEHFRDVVRCVEDARKDLMRSRHRLSKFLLRRGVRFPCKAWTQPHEQWLCKLSFDDTLSQATFIDYLAAMQGLVQRRRALIGVLEEAAPQSSHARSVERLRCFRGIDTLTAAGLCAEVGNFERFEKPALLSGFLGVVPSEYTSDDKRVQGQITKAGPTHARRLLVEAAHHYRHKPAVGLGLRARQADQDPRVVQIAWRAQRRLHERWIHLGQRRGKPTGTVAIACARELACFCWEAATLD